MAETQMEGFAEMRPQTAGYLQVGPKSIMSELTLP